MAWCNVHAPGIRIDLLGHRMMGTALHIKAITRSYPMPFPWMHDAVACHLLHACASC